MRFAALVVLTGTALLTIRSAAEPSADTANRAAALAPLVEEETLALVRFDATKFDADATLLRLKELVPGHASDLERAVTGVKELQTGLTTAGGTEAVVAFSTAELPWPSYAFVKMKEGADEAALAGLLKQMFNENWRVEKKANGLLAGGPAALARLAAGKPAERPELADAVAAAGDGCAQMLLLPSDDARRVVDEVLPLALGGGSVSAKALTRGVRWAAVGIDGGPRPALRLTVRSADGAAAGDLARLLREGLAALGRHRFAGEKKPLADLVPAEFKAAAAALDPSVQGDRLTVAVADPDALRPVAALVAALDKEVVAGGASNADVNKMKQIVLAFHNYANVYKGSFPPTAIRSKDGKPLLSWRVEILPFLDENKLYKEFHLDEPWDSAHNKRLIERIPKVFRSSGARNQVPGVTTFLVPVGKEVAFTGEAKGRQMVKEFTDGTSNTILLVDAAGERGVIWTRPDDLAIDPKQPKKGLNGEHAGRFLFGMADGSIKRVSKDVSDKTLWAAFTVAGGETPGSDW